MSRKTAHWIRHTHVFRKDDYECSSCGARTDRPYTTCPSCGNRMKGSKYDPSWVDEVVLMDTILDD